MNITPENLLESLEDTPAANPAPESKRITPEKLATHRITSDSDIPDPVSVVRIGGANFAIKGDISFISGQPKAGKTTISSILIATALMKKVPSDLDTLGIECDFCDGKEVVYVDTEQPKQYAKKMLETVKNYMNVHREPKNFHFYNLRDYQNNEKFNVVKGMFEMYPQAHLWIIDGLADLVRNINNEEETSEVMGWFMAVASKLNTTIILVLHENPSSDKMRGHLGSEAMRKAGGAIAIKKDRQKGVHWIESRVIRGSADFDNIFFHYDKDLKRMVSIHGTAGDIDRQVDPTVQKKEHLVKIAKQATVQGSETLSYKDLTERVSAYFDYPKKISRATAQRKIKDMVEARILGQNPDDKSYYLINHNKPLEDVPDKIFGITDNEAPF